MTTASSGTAGLHFAPAERHAYMLGIGPVEPPYDVSPDGRLDPGRIHDDPYVQTAALTSAAGPVLIHLALIGALSGSTRGAAGRVVATMSEVRVAIGCFPAPGGGGCCDVDHASLPAASPPPSLSQELAWLSCS